MVHKSNFNNILLLLQHNRSFSTAPSAASTATAARDSNGNDAKDSSSSNDSDKKEKKKDESNIFLDNLGKIFLAVIASVILALVRGSYNTSTRATLRNQIEDDATLDPGEIDDLRVANSELTPDIFRLVVKDVYAAFPSGVASYNDFVQVARKTMAQSKGEAFTIELGHMIDRVVVDILQTKKAETLEHNQSVSMSSSSTTTMTSSSDDPTTMPVSLWLAVLSLALSSEVKDRIRILYEILEQEPDRLSLPDQASFSSVSEETVDGGSDDGRPASESPCVTIRQVQDMIDYLQSSCQLPADTQIVATDRKYPIQVWKRGNSKDLVPWEGSDRDVIDLRTFATIIRSKSVCAWGECYHRKNFDNEEV
jgi:archaellum component FlaG (FlaF/FlaG flagellin family)